MSWAHGARLICVQVGEGWLTVVSTIKETAFRFLTSKGIYKNNMSSVFWSASAQSPIKKLIFLNYIRLDLPTGPFVFDLVGWKLQNFFKTKNIPRTHPQVWFYLFTCSYVTKESDSKLNEEIIIKPKLISEKHVNLQNYWLFDRAWHFTRSSLVSNRDYID